MKSFREFMVMFLSFFCCITAYAQKEYNGVVTVPVPMALPMALGFQTLLCP